MDLGKNSEENPLDFRPGILELWYGLRYALLALAPTCALIACTTWSIRGLEGRLPCAIVALPPPRPPAAKRTVFSKFPACTPESEEAASMSAGGSPAIARKTAFEPPVKA